MNEDHQARIDQIIADGYNFKFGDYISNGFDILKKNLGGFILFTLLLIIISFVISLIPLVGFVANSFFISPALTAGIFWVANKVWKNEMPEFSDFFRGFDFIGQLALTALLQFIIVMLALVPFIMAIWDSGMITWYMDILSDPTIAAQGEMPPLPASWTFLLLAPMIYLAVSYSWSYMFVIFYKMPAWDAMEASRKLISKNWLIYFLFVIVISLIAAAGAIIVCIGLLATMPAMYCMHYAAFEDITQLHAEPGTDDDIEKHLVD